MINIGCNLLTMVRDTAWYTKWKNKCSSTENCSHFGLTLSALEPLEVFKSLKYMLLV